MSFDITNSRMRDNMRKHFSRVVHADNFLRDFQKSEGGLTRAASHVQCKINSATFAANISDVFYREWMKKWATVSVPFSRSSICEIIHPARPPASSLERVYASTGECLWVTASAVT